MKSTSVGLMCSVAAVLAVTTGAARAVTAPASLNSCQNAVRVATANFIESKVGVISACLQAVSKEIVQNNAASVAGAASTCVKLFRRLNDSRGLGRQLSDKLAAAITKRCAPGQIGVTHTLADILGSGAGVPQPLLAEDLNTWCTHFGGDGSIDTLQEWTGCIAAAAECGVDSAIATQYPRALEWLALVRPAMQALSSSSADPTQVSDAVAGLDAIKAAIDGPDNDNVVSLQCGNNGQCDAALESCSTSLNTCSTSLGTCNGSLGTCNTNLATCGAGTAAPADVLAGKTFSGSGGIGTTGTMPDNGAVTLVPSTTDQAIAAGYHNGAGRCAGDPDLIPDNIAAGVDLFGVVGTGYVIALPAQILKSGQTIPYGPGSDGDLQKGIPLAYADNGDGTISDLRTGLMWEKKSDDGSVHDVGNTYTWGMDTSPYLMNGTMVTAFLAQLNNRCNNDASVACSADADCAVPGGPCGFAGHRDWRIPNVREMHSMVNFGVLSSVFNNGCSPGCSVSTCSCTTLFFYWSSSTFMGVNNAAWAVGFGFGETYPGYSKSEALYLRAVRGDTPLLPATGQTKCTRGATSARLLL